MNQKVAPLPDKHKKMEEQESNYTPIKELSEASPFEEVAPQ